MGPLSHKTCGWEMRLAKAVQTAHQTPFKWSVHDCPTFAFGLRAALTGLDATQAWVGRYDSLRSGLRLMRTLGWASYQAMGSALLGDPLASVFAAQRGDIVLGPRGGFGVVLGQEVVGMTQAGLMTMPLAACPLGWRV